MLVSCVYCNEEMYVVEPTILIDIFNSWGLRHDLPELLVATTFT